MAVSGEVTEIEALETNLWSLWANFGRGLNSRLVDTPKLMWFETPIRALPYNAVMRTKVARGAEAEVDTLFAHFEAAGKPFLWLVHPSAQPDNLADLLAARGFEEVEVCPGMVARINGLPEPGPAPESIEIREVLSSADQDAMVDFVIWRWDAPQEAAAYLASVREQHHLGEAASPTRVWMAWKGNLAVAKAITHEANGVIGLYGVATRPEARGAGLGRQICLHALRETDAGRGKLGVLHSSPMAVNLYRRMGFHEVAPFRLFAAGAFHI